MPINEQNVVALSILRLFTEIHDLFSCSSGLIEMTRQELVQIPNFVVLITNELPYFIVQKILKGFASNGSAAAALPDAHLVNKLRNKLSKRIL
jgi:hypothetical protein